MRKQQTHLKELVKETVDKVNIITFFVNRKRVFLTISHTGLWNRKRCVTVACKYPVKYPRSKISSYLAILNAQNKVECFWENDQIVLEDRCFIR